MASLLHFIHGRILEHKFSSHPTGHCQHLLCGWGAGLSSDTDTYWHTEPGLPEPSDLVAYTGPVLLAV